MAGKRTWKRASRQWLTRDGRGCWDVGEVVEVVVIVVVGVVSRSG